MLQPGLSPLSVRGLTGDATASADAGCDKVALLALNEDATPVSRASSGTPTRVLRNGYPRFQEDHPAALQPFPDQLARSMQDGADQVQSDRSRLARGWRPPIRTPPIRKG